jgi:NAD+ synthase (glutamine-hydrolysing)
VRPIDDIVDAVCAASLIEVGTAEHKTAQAMARMHVLAAIAAKEHAFFTCNANWTESFFGYGTLNGDLRGTFAPWGNCLKQDVYRLGDYMNREVFGREVIPQSIIDRQPMDELVAEGQGSRGDPFDYGNVRENGYHDQLVRAVIAFRHGPEWFVEHFINGTLERELQLPEGKLAELFPDGQAWLDDLERCFNLYHAAIFKRVQSVPNVLVDKRTFGWDFRESIVPLVTTTTHQTFKNLLNRVAQSSLV